MFAVLGRQLCWIPNGDVERSAGGGDDMMLTSYGGRQKKSNT